MSTPPIVPGMTQAPAPARDTLAQAPSTASKPVAEVARTITTSAVQQAQASSESDDLARLRRAILEDKRSRLVGPSPAFQVSLLEHIRETIGDPPVEDDNLPDAEPTPQGDQPEAPERPTENTSYKTLQSMKDADSPDIPTFKRSI